MGVPLTSKRKEGSYFSPISFKGIEGAALLNQVKVIDSRRLQERMGSFTNKQIKDIKERLRALI